MHFTWALLLALNVHDRRWRWAFIIYAVLMAFATVASGEHYFIDVIVAIPFSFAGRTITQSRTFASAYEYTAKAEMDPIMPYRRLGDFRIQALTIEPPSRRKETDEIRRLAEFE